MRSLVCNSIEVPFILPILSVFYLQNWQFSSPISSSRSLHRFFLSSIVLPNNIFSYIFPFFPYYSSVPSPITVPKLLFHASFANSNYFSTGFLAKFSVIRYSSFFSTKRANVKSRLLRTGLFVNLFVNNYCYSPILTIRSTLRFTVNVQK